MGWSDHPHPGVEAGASGDLAASVFCICPEIPNALVCVSLKGVVGLSSLMLPTVIWIPLRPKEARTKASCPGRCWYGGCRWLLGPGRNHIRMRVQCLWTHGVPAPPPAASVPLGPQVGRAAPRRTKKRGC